MKDLWEVISPIQSGFSQSVLDFAEAPSLVFRSEDDVEKLVVEGFWVLESERDSTHNVHPEEAGLLRNQSQMDQGFICSNEAGALGCQSKGCESPDLLV